MTLYEVVWDFGFEDIVAQFLVSLSREDRRALSEAIRSAERALKRDAQKKSSPIHEGFWLYEEPPFRFLFKLEEEQRVVKLVQVTRFKNK